MQAVSAPESNLSGTQVASIPPNNEGSPVSEFTFISMGLKA